MANERIQMPSSGAGLTRYFDDYKSKIEFRPAQVIVMALVVMFITLLLHLYGAALLGV